MNICMYITATEKFKKLAKQTQAKINELKIKESFERLLPLLFGFQVKYVPGRAVAGVCVFLKWVAVCCSVV